jgi:serine/threonine protein kinase
MANPAEQAESIFRSAIETQTPAQWPAFLDGACGKNTELRERVEQLLQAHAAPDGRQNCGETWPIDQPLTEEPSTQIGPYKLLQRLGEGGMGVVYMAEQTQPVQRRVALKIIKPGMDTRQVIARFEAERQALAMMDHPNIARVLDAGTTDGGRPYFAMELVKGIPITKYCDEHRLTVTQRLELFADVCHAVQHAHQKGIIHRDLKPSNVLIAEYDDHAVPKIIDFGLAKAVQQRLTEKTMFTQVGQVVGTLEYMSPEQAKLNQLDIDTRSDIYSLGVLLYELLAGETPFDRSRLRSAAFDELLRILREEEPPRPSLRLSSSPSLPSIAAKRHVEPRKLGTLVRGELDWIVMKAMEKQRTRRYETASALAADVVRYLGDEPVQACPPSASYRFRKFALRNKAVLTAAAVALLCLLTVAVGSSVAATRYRRLANENAALIVETDAALVAETSAKDAARQAQQEAESARNQEQQRRREAERQKQRVEANSSLARSAVDGFLNRVTENELLTVPGLQSLRQELLSAAMGFYEEFSQDEASADQMQLELARSYSRIARIRSELGQSREARDANARSIERFEQMLEEDQDTVEVRLELADAYFWAKRYDDTVTLCKEILTAEPKHAEARRLLATTYNSLAIAEDTNTDVAAALDFHQKALTIRQALIEEFPDKLEYLADIGSTINNLGVLLDRQRKGREALAMYQQALTFKADAFQKAPERILWGRWVCIGLRNVAFKQSSFGQQDEALKSFEQAAAIRSQLAYDNPAVPSLKGELYKAWLDVGNYQRELGKKSAANRSFRLARQVLENIPRNTPAELFELALVYAELAKPAEESAELSAEETAELRDYADLALQSLQQAVDGGYQDAQALETNESLGALRQRKDFQLLEKGLRAKQLATSDVDKVEEDDRVLATELLQELRELVGDSPTDLQHRQALADALHAVGVTENGQGNHQAAETALEEEMTLRVAIHEEDAENPWFKVDLGAVSVARGHVCWKSERFPEAVQHWKTALQLFDSAKSFAPDDPALQQQVAFQERTVFQRYGECGMWERAVEYVTRNLLDGKSYQKGWDPRFAHLLAVLGRWEEHDQLCRLLVDQWGESDPQVAWVAALNPHVTIDQAELIELAEFSDGDWDFRLTKFWAGTIFYRLGQYDRALELMQQGCARDLGAPGYRYWYALVDHKRGEDEKAGQMFEQAESAYLQRAQAYLQGPAATAVRDVTNGNWQVLAEDQIMRQQAWLEIRGQDAPEDPWQHLILARSYRLLSENEKCEAELAAAVAAAPNDPDVWLARIRLRREAGDPAHAVEADCAELVAIAGDDHPLERAIDLAEIHVALKQWDKAIECYDRIIKLRPENIYDFKIRSQYEFLSLGLDRYRERCREALERYLTPQATLQHKIQVADMCCMVSDAVDDTKAIVQLVREIAAASPPNPASIERMLAMALLNDGQFTEALPMLLKIESQANETYTSVSRFLLAKAHHAIGQHEVAVDWLRQGDALALQLLEKGEFEHAHYPRKILVAQKEAHDVLGIPLPTAAEITVPETDPTEEQKWPAEAAK